MKPTLLSALHAASAIALALPLWASASDWKPLPPHPKLDQDVFLDADSVHLQDGRLHATLMFKEHVSRSLTKLTPPVLFLSVKTHTSYDCVKHNAILHSIEYFSDGDAKGKAVHTVTEGEFRSSGSLEPFAIAPGAPGEGGLQAACALQPTKP